MTVRVAAGPAETPLTIAAYVPRERVRSLLSRAFPRRKARLEVCRSADDLQRVFTRTLVDAVMVDVGAPTEDTWAAAGRAPEFPCAPFFGIGSFRVADAPSIARCAALEFVDVFADGIDDSALGSLVVPHAFTARFAAALMPASDILGLSSSVQQKAWRWIAARGGRPVRTDLLARALGITREHLSRSFATGRAPNLKRVIDLVRVVAAAELSKCPGYDTSDVARVLRFASASHMATTSERVCGARVASLARLRAGDIIERFLAGRTRSRA